MIIITKNTTWKAGAEIRLSDEVQVAPNVTLTIEAGAKISGGGITAFGSIIADGSEKNPIIMRNLKLKVGQNDQTAKIHLDNVFFDYDSITADYQVNVKITNSSLFMLMDDLRFNRLYGDNEFQSNSFRQVRDIELGTSYGAINIEHNYFDFTNGAQIKIDYNSDEAPISRNNIYLGPSDKPKIELGSRSTLTSIGDYFDTSAVTGVNKAIYDRNDNLEIFNYVKLQHPALSIPAWAPSIYKSYSGGINLVGLAARDGQSLGDGPDLLAGNEYDNKLIGNSGNNLFYESEGTDTYIGGKGDDLYDINSAGDLVIEYKNEGYDTVRTNTNYALLAGQEIEKIYIGSGRGLSYDMQIDSIAINIRGNEFGQIIIGNNANNIIDGKGGIDIMQGLKGNDTYYVDHKADHVVEADGEGTDTIVTTVSYTLAAGQAVEILKFAKGVGAAALNLSGNEFANTLVGSAGNNVLNGDAGADTMYGGIGDDTYVVDNANDKVSEAKGAGTDTVLSSVGYALKAGQEIESLRLTGKAGSVNLTGNEFGQTLVGNVGANVLDGRLGADVLIGGKGADTFVFSTALGAENVDRITDFSTVDTIRLSKSIFSALAPGELKANEFKDIAKGKVDADDHILYDSRTGDVFYDADGSGKAAAVKFAVLDNKAAITHADFLIV